MRLASLDYHYSALGREHATAASHARWHSVRPGRITRWHASMAASARLGCPCDACDRQWLPRHCFAASRRAPCLACRAEPSLPSLPCAGRRRIPRFVLSSPQNAPTRRAGAHSFFARRPRTLMQKLRRCGRIASYTAAAAQGRYVNNSTIRGARLDTRAAARAAPRQTKFCFPERVTVRG